MPVLVVTPVVPVDTVFVMTGDSVIGGCVFGGCVIGGCVTGGHDDLARPSQAIPVSHSSVVTIGFLPKKS